MAKKLVLTFAVAAFAALGGASSAAAATPSTNVTDLSLKITTAKLIVDGLLPDGIEVPGSDPALVGKTINVDGTLSYGGKVSIAPSGFDFPAVGLGDALPIPGVTADIVLGETSSTGTLNTTTGAATVPLNLGVVLGAPDLGISCLIKGLNFGFTTGNATVGTTTLFGSAYSKTTGAVALTGKANLPDISKISLSDCSIAGLAAGLGISGKAVALKLSGTATIGTSYKKPAVATLSGSSSTTFDKNGKSTGVKVKCGGTASTSRPCAGTVSVVVASKGVTVSAPYTAAPGKTVTVPLQFAAGQKSLIRGTSSAANVSVSSKVNISVDNGTGVKDKSGTLKAAK